MVIVDCLTDNPNRTFGDGRPPCPLRAPLTVIPFPRYQVSIPTQDRIGRHDRAPFHQRRPSERFAFDREDPPLFVCQE